MPNPSHAEIEEDLLTNPRYAAFFAPYHPQALAGFARQYALEKFQWQSRGAEAEANQTYALSQLSDAAYTRLWDIQRKKLFDLQCRWRAGQLHRPGLECSFDFGSNDAAIENCSLLEPISPEELDMYCDFVRLAPDFDADVLDYYGEDGILPRNWQDHHGMRRFEEGLADNAPDNEPEGVAPPAWYDFHNSRTGNGGLLALLALPDLRGPLEQRYLTAYYSHRRAEYAAHPSPPPPADPRPTVLPLAEVEALQHAFLHQFETPKLRRKQAAYLAEQDRQAADKQVEEDFAYLKALGPDEAVPLEATADWRAALRRAVVETQRQQLLAHLPQVYEAYLLRQQQGISHPEASAPYWRDHSRHLHEALLDGRELLGEPRTFDF